MWEAGLLHYCSFFGTVSILCEVVSDSETENDHLLSRKQRRRTLEYPHMTGPRRKQEIVCELEHAHSSLAFSTE